MDAPEPNWVSVEPRHLRIELVTPDSPLEPLLGSLFISSEVGSSSCNRYDYQVEHDGTTIKVTWSQYGLVGEGVACTTDYIFAREWIPVNTGLTPSQLYTVTVN